MKKIFITLMCIFMLLGISACAKKEEEPSTVGTSLKQMFEEEAKKSDDPETLINVLKGNKKLEMSLMTMEMEEGYMPGFDEEVHGFDKAFILTPKIGTIPFVCYVFKVESDAEGFLENIKAIANPRWNICTEADETEYSVQGNLVFFVMCSNEG